MPAPPVGPKIGVDAVDTLCKRARVYRSRPEGPLLRSVPRYRRVRSDVGLEQPPSRSVLALTLGSCAAAIGRCCHPKRAPCGIGPRCPPKALARKGAPPSASASPMRWESVQRTFTLSRGGHYSITVRPTSQSTRSIASTGSSREFFSALAPAMRTSPAAVPTWARSRPRYRTGSHG